MTVIDETGITTPVEVPAEIERVGFAIVPGTEIKLAEHIARAVPDFVESYDDLPVDPYMADGGRYRRRRLTRYIYDVDSRKISTTENPGYFQAVEHNPFAGGQLRKFEELRESVRENAYLQAMIAFNARLWGRPDVRRWKVQAHCIRTLVTPGHLGRPTPEGAHRDGVSFLGVHLVRKNNIVGGETSVYTPDEHLLGRVVLADFLDSFFGDDHRVRHGVSDVELADPHGDAGIRDMLLLGYEPA
jgi:hypothetical protein